eukprot:12402308-Karenia_brevis.AAC.1
MQTLAKQAIPTALACILQLENTWFFQPCSHFLVLPGVFTSVESRGERLDKKCAGESSKARLQLQELRQSSRILGHLCELHVPHHR